MKATPPFQLRGKRGMSTPRLRPISPTLRVPNPQPLILQQWLLLFLSSPLQAKGTLFPRGSSVATGLTLQQITRERGGFNGGIELKKAEGCHPHPGDGAEPTAWSLCPPSSPCRDKMNFPSEMAPSMVPTSPHSHLHPSLCLVLNGDIALRKQTNNSSHPE